MIPILALPIKILKFFHPNIWQMSSDQMFEFRQSLLRLNDTQGDAEKLALYDHHFAIFYGMLKEIITTTSIQGLNEIGQKVNRKEGMNAAEFNAEYMQMRNSLSISYKWIDTYFK